EGLDHPVLARHPADPLVALDRHRVGPSAGKSADCRERVGRCGGVRSSRRPSGAAPRALASWPNMRLSPLRGPSMRNATDLLAQYAEYHRDRRNIVSHFVGVPMIVFGIGVLLARATFPAFGVSLTLAWIVFALAAAWYMTRGNIVLGITVSLAVGVLIKLGHEVSGGSVALW